MQLYNQKDGFFIRVLIVLLFSACINKISAQQVSINEMVVGTWTFVDAASIAKMPIDIQQELQSSPNLQNHIASFYTGRQMNFYADGTYSLIFPNGLNINGQWNISGNTLTTQNNDGSSATQQIVFLDTDHFYLISQQFSNSDARVLFPELHFIKN